MQPFKILYSDNHIIVAEKPRGLATQPHEHQKNSLEDEVKAWVKEAYNKPGAIFLHVVHRLDQVVSGIVLFAKTSKALERLNASMKEKAFKKIYIAEVEGLIHKEKETLIHYIRHDEFKAEVFTQKKEDAKEAILDYQVIRQHFNSTILKIELKTGRYHQIRAQMKAIGHPVVGDTKYGAKKIEDEGIHLHHAILEFIHPVTKEKMRIISQPDFLKVPVKLM